MGIYLSNRDIQHYRSVAEVLLSPLDHPDVSAWSTAVLRRVEVLFGADRSMLVFPDQGKASAHSLSIPEDRLMALQAAVSAMAPGAFRSDQPQVDAVMQSRREAGMHIWHNEALAQSAGVDLRDMPFYHEAMVPAGVAYGSGIVSSLPVGEAWLSIAHSNPAEDPFGVDAGMQLLHMLHPLFTVAARTLASFSGHQGSLIDTLEALGKAVMAYDRSGCKYYCTTTLRELLRREKEADMLMRAMRDLAVSLTSVHAENKRVDGFSVGQRAKRTISTKRTSYSLTALLVGEGTATGAPGVLVEVATPHPTLPSARDLMARYGLTAREGEVTLLLARGLSNREIAHRLNITTHTVRAHAEHIFEKLGVHSRKALGLRLLTRP